MDFTTIALVLIGVGILSMRVAGVMERKHRRSSGEGHKLMDEVDKKREQYEQAIKNLQRECPEVADIIPRLAATDDRWFGRVIERLTDRSVQKNREEKIKLVAQAKRFYAEYRGALEEQRGALEAMDDLVRVKKGTTFEEKDEEAEIRRLERRKRKTALERDIEELQKKPEPAQPRARRPPKMERVAQMRKQQADDHKKYANDLEMQSLVDRDWDDKIMRTMEESD